MAHEPRERKEYLRSVEDLMRTITELQDTLREAHRSYRKVRTRLEEDGSLKEALSTVPTAASRKNLTEKMEAVEAARRRTRVSSFALGLSEGMSASEMARIFGFSRQLAAGYAKEAKTGSGLGAPGR